MKELGAGREEQGSLGIFILNWAIHLCKSRLELLAELFSSITDLQSLQLGGEMTLVIVVWL